MYTIAYVLSSSDTKKLIHSKPSTQKNALFFFAVTLNNDGYGVWKLNNVHIYLFSDIDTK